MGIVLGDVSISLDGFMTGPHVSVEQPMGVGGMRLHDWLLGPSGDEQDAGIARETYEATGAVVLGRRVFDVGVGQWEDTPYPVPSFVLTHRPHAPLAMKSGAFTFVTDGIESALRQAQAAAGEKRVVLMGGDITRQFLQAGLLDELQMHLVPVLLGTGTRLFEHSRAAHIELERIALFETPNATHLRFRVLK